MADTRKTGSDAKPDGESLVEIVKKKYGEIAGSKKSGCCGPAPETGCCAPAEKAPERLGYTAEDLAALPGDADLGLGCGAPINHLELRPGETVLDLGSGAGVDVFIAAGKVGPEGKAIGVDMTPQMVARARDNAAKGQLGRQTPGPIRFLLVFRLHNKCECRSFRQNPCPSQLQQARQA